ncbi:hypothetical protein BU17DRAFT_47625, partial [Hysterangium stoloniferum]
FNPGVHMQHMDGNIREAWFDIGWFKTFNIVLNGLDNLDARWWVRVFASELRSFLMMRSAPMTTGMNTMLRSVIRAAARLSS